MGYIGEASNRAALEFAIVEFLYGSTKISCAFKLNEPWASEHISNFNLDCFRGGEDKPSSAAITASFGIHHIKAGLSGEVLEVLFPEVRVSR